MISFRFVRLFVSPEISEIDIILMSELSDCSHLVVWWGLYQRMEVIKVVFVAGLVRNIHSSLRNSAITENVAQLLARAVKMTRFPSSSDNSTALKFSVFAESKSQLL